MGVTLVTGGAGFIGSNFIRRVLCREPDTHIVNLDALTYAGNLANLEDIVSDSRYQFIEGDVNNFEFLVRLLEEYQIDSIVHFAAESHVDRSIDGSEAFVKTNVLGTFNLLQAFEICWEARRKPKGMRLLHVSTDEVFGSLSSDAPAFSESTPYDPRSPYSASKAGSDHLVMSYYHTFGLPVLMTNCSNNYGPYQFPEKLIPLMILNAIEGNKLPIYGDGMNIRDWLYVEDHCDAISCVLEHGQLGESYNIGGEAEKTNLHIVDLLCEILDQIHPRQDGESYAKHKIFVQDRLGHDRRYSMDISKIKRELNWSPEMKFEQGIRQTVEWYLSNREWCEDITSGSYQRQRLGAG